MPSTFPSRAHRSFARNCCRPHRLLFRAAIAGQRAYSGGSACSPRCQLLAPRDVEQTEPQGLRDERHADDADAGSGRKRRRRRARREAWHREDEDGPDRGSDAQEAGALEPLTGDRRPEKARPPEDDTMRRLAGKPEDLADPPGDGAQRHDRGGERRLAPEESRRTRAP